MRWNSRSVKARKFHRLAHTPLMDLSMPSSSVSSGSWVLESVQPRAAEAGQVLVVGAGPVAQRLPLGVGGVHALERFDDPLGRLPFLDLLAQLLELVLLGVEVRLEVRVGQHLLDVVVEAVVLHELVVEVERHREPVGHGPVREAQRPQNGHVRRLDPERGPVAEPDVAQGGDLGDREVPLRRLGLRRARSDVVGIDLRGRGGAQGPSAVGHGVVDVAADEIVDVDVVEGAADEMRLGRRPARRAG